MFYTRGTVWGDGGVASAADLNAEFDRIQEVLANLERTNFVAGEVETPLFVNAGDERFQTGGLDAAELVAAAIAEAVAGDIKIVFVPKTMFHYAGEAGFDPGMFNFAVGLIHEGGPWDGYDPIAYGAKPDDAAVDDGPSIGACFAAIAAGTSPLPQVLSFSTPGEYKIDTALGASSGPIVFHPSQIALLDPGTGGTSTAANDVTFAGTQLSTFKPNVTTYAPPYLLQLKAVASGSALAGGTDTTFGAQTLVDIAEDFVVRAVMARARETTTPDAFTDRWAHGVGAAVGSDDNIQGGAPSIIATIVSIYTEPGTNPGEVKFQVQIKVENTTGGALDWEVEYVLVVERVRFALANTA